MRGRVWPGLYTPVSTTACPTQRSGQAQGPCESGHQAGFATAAAQGYCTPSASCGQPPFSVQRTAFP